jgi:iron(III) transport system permease protein
MAMGNFAVPHVLQCHLYSIQIYTRMTSYLDQEGCVRAAAPLVAATLVLAAFVALCETGRKNATAEVQRPVKLRLGRYRWAAGGILAGVLLINVGLPLSAILWRCQSPELFLQATRDAVPEMQNTLIIAGAAGLVAVGAGLAVALWVAASRRVMPEILATIPIAVPGLVAGLAYLRFYNRTWPIDLSVIGSGSLLVILGLGFRGWPFAFRVIANGQRQIAPEWNEAARLGGLSGWRRRVWITIPLMFDQLAAAAVIAFVLAVGDVELSQMLCAPGQGTLALRLFTFLHFGPAHVAASLAAVQLVMAATPVLLYYLLFNRGPPFV